MPTARRTLSRPEKEGPSPPKTFATFGFARKTWVERQHDEADEARDHRLEPAEASRLEGKDAEGDDAGDDAGEEERDAEEQVETERRTEELGQVGRHGDHLGLDPEAHRHRARKTRAAHLGQVHAGGDPELGAHGLDEHRHQVGGDDDPEQEVAELGAAGHVRGEVARVDVGHTGDERRPQERPDGADAARLTREGLGCGAEHTRLAGQDVFGLDQTRRSRRPSVFDGRLSHEI